MIATARTKEKTVTIKRKKNCWQISCPICNRLVARTDAGASFLKAQKCLVFLILNHVENEHHTTILVHWNSDREEKKAEL